MSAGEALADIRTMVESYYDSAVGKMNVEIVKRFEDLDGALSRGEPLPLPWAPPGLVRISRDDLQELLRDNRRLIEIAREIGRPEEPGELARLRSREEYYRSIVAGLVQARRERRTAALLLLCDKLVEVADLETEAAEVGA